MKQANKVNKTGGHEKYSHSVKLAGKIAISGRHAGKPNLTGNRKTYAEKRVKIRIRFIFMT